ncbi:gasdermin-C [Dromiciops gliroides]|uniref:gasdermin-C n=1 Tax=Dromiciops gliroides TaxID=33562 RepID=UPI001CC65B1A|nr:gasdermin-C [Dromiciops gliroides]
MPSMFECDAKKVVKELGRKGDLIPVQSLLNSTRFHPFCLVRKKKKKFPWFFESPFFDTYFSLMDILEPSFPVPGKQPQTHYPSSNFFPQSEGQSQKDKKKLVTIHQGCILAYRVLELFFENDGWRVLYIPDEITPRLSVEEFYMDKLTGKIIGAPREFEELLEMMIREQEALSKGPKELLVTLFHAFWDVLGNRKALQDMEDMLDQAPDMRDKNQLESPMVWILRHLQSNSGDASDQQTESILYFLGALMILTDTQQQLLAQSLEKKILPQQLALVKSILEPHFGLREETSFSIQPELFSQFKDEDQVITMNLVEDCGLNLQCAESQTKWYPEAKNPLSALYVALSFLQLLSQA